MKRNETRPSVLTRRQRVRASCRSTPTHAPNANRFQGPAARPTAERYQPVPCPAISPRRTKSWSPAGMLPVLFRVEGTTRPQRLHGPLGRANGIYSPRAQFLEPSQTCCPLRGSGAGGAQNRHSAQRELVRSCSGSADARCRRHSQQRRLNVACITLRDPSGAHGGHRHPARHRPRSRSRRTHRPGVVRLHRRKRHRQHRRRNAWRHGHHYPRPDEHHARGDHRRDRLVPLPDPSAWRLHGVGGDARVQQRDSLRRQRHDQQHLAD